MERIVVRLLAVSFFVIGVMNLLSPASGLGLFGFDLSNPSVLNEARANYGGMHIFTGLLFWHWSLKDESLVYALSLAFMFCAGLVFGRVVSLFVDGMPNGLLLSFMGLEIGASVLCVILLVRIKRSA